MSSRADAYWFLAVAALVLAVAALVAALAHVAPLWLLRLDEALVSLPAILLRVQNIAVMFALGVILGAALLFFPLVLLYELARALRSVATWRSALRAE